MDDHAHLGHERRPVELLDVANGARHVLIGHDGASEAIVEIWRDRHVPFAGDPLGHVLDMGIEAESLHDHDDGRIGALAHGRAEVGRHQTVGGR